MKSIVITALLGMGCLSVRALSIKEALAALETSTAIDYSDSRFEFVTPRDQDAEQSYTQPSDDGDITLFHDFTNSLDDSDENANAKDQGQDLSSLPSDDFWERCLFYNDASDCSDGPQNPDDSENYSDVDWGFYD